MSRKMIQYIVNIVNGFDWWNSRAKSYTTAYVMYVYVYVCALFIERQMAWEIIDQIYL